MNSRNHTPRRVGRFSAVVAVVLAFALLLTGCGANSQNNANDGDGGQGGDLTIFSQSSEMSFDPAKSQSLAITSMGLVVRRLTTWEVPKDGGPTKVVPDLATDTGTPSDDGRTWTFTLKENLKFQDGSEITTADIKYGIERSFAPELSGGLGYHKTLLAGAENYKGPYSGQSLDSIETPDAKTIVFKLNAPYGDWPWIASMPAFGPVQKSMDTDPQKYGEKPSASGPYQVESYRQGVSMVLSRNPGWDKATDPVRSGGPDTVTFALNQNATVAAQKLIADSGADKNAFGANFVPPSQLAQVQGNPSAFKRLVTSKSGALAYLAMNTQRPLLKDLKMRQAIEYAVDKNSYRIASGGELAGDFATTLITQGIAGRQDYDLYETDPSGDVEKAKALLAEAGYSGQTLKFISRNDAQSIAQSEAIQAGLNRAGIKTEIVPLEENAWTDAATGAAGDYDLTLGSWQPDFPSANANIQPLYDSREIGNGGYNVSRYSNPAVDAAIKDALQAVDPNVAQQKWAEVDRTIAEDAPVVPLIYTKNSFLIGSNVRDFYIGEFPAYPNYLAVTLAQ